MIVILSGEDFPLRKLNSINPATLLPIALTIVFPPCSNYAFECKLHTTAPVAARPHRLGLK
jgi:hypothetical protein